MVAERRQATSAIGFKRSSVQLIFGVVKAPRAPRGLYRTRSGTSRPGVPFCLFDAASRLDGAMQRKCVKHADLIAGAVHFSLTCSYIASLLLVLPLGEAFMDVEHLYATLAPDQRPSTYSFVNTGLSFSGMVIALTLLPSYSDLRLMTSSQYCYGRLLAQLAI